MLGIQVSPELEIEISKDVAKFYQDPLGFVMYAYPWGQPGVLEKETGPDDWQRDFLIDLGSEVRKRGFDGTAPVMPIRMGTASGHGVGKSTLVAWLVDWIMSTRPNAQGTVTANTYKQLSTKTWAQIKKWTKLCITSSWFTVQEESMFFRNKKESWCVQAQSCKEENSEAFAGQHEKTSTSFYINDEASAIPDKIWEVEEGGLTDGEAMIFAFGNATRDKGKFHRIMFGSERGTWIHRSVDSRQSKIANKPLIEEWKELYGEDSDFFRVRVRGLPPRASGAQFIDLERVTDAQKRKPVILDDEPLIAGVDFAWGGDDKNVARIRRGADASSIKPLKIPGEFTCNEDVMVGKLAELLNKRFPEYGGQKITTMFLDSAGIAGKVTHKLKEMGFTNVYEINFGADSPDYKYGNMRSYMWGSMKDWLLTGSIDSDRELEEDLTGPGYRHDSKVRILLEKKEDMKKRDLDSPDDGDALALTFAHPVKHIQSEEQMSGDDQASLAEMQHEEAIAS